MDGSDATRPSLIARVRDAADAPAWAEFVSLYGPLVRRVARRAGLQDADADDLAQDALRAVAAAMLELSVRPDGFRGWLYTVTRNKLIDFFRSAKHRDRGAGDAAALERLGAIPAPPEEPEWDREYERQVLSWVSDRVRDEFRETTWRAFWQTAIEGRSGPDVARELGMSVGAIHVARSRVLTRLKAAAREHLGDD